MREAPPLVFLVDSLGRTPGVNPLLVCVNLHKAKTKEIKGGYRRVTDDETAVAD